MIFNNPVPQDLGFVDRTKEENRFLYEVDFLVTKKTLGRIIDPFHHHGQVVGAQHHILGGHRHRAAIGGLEEVVGGQHAWWT